MGRRRVWWYGYGYGAAALGLGLLGGAIIGSQYPYSDSGYGYGAEYNVDRRTKARYPDLLREQV